MVNTILFDLDGTLLSMDTDLFIKQYFGHIADHLKDYFTQEEVVKLFWQGTEKVIKSQDASKTNQEVFMESFFSQVDYKEEQLMPVLNDFYDNKFDLLKTLSKSKQQMIESIEILKNKGYELVIATNPIFPIAANHSRVEWANLDPNDFKLITAYETSHFAKPNINYYKEVLKDIDKEAHEVLMVGNHMQEDMVSNTIGIDTFLITNHIMGDDSNKENVTHEGDYDKFLAFVEELPQL